MSNKFDVIVIGGGPGGTPAAMQLASRGQRVLLVEESGKPGGACLFFGCIPSKILRHWANEISTERKYANKRTWSSEDRKTAWNQIKDKKNHILEQRSRGALQALTLLPTLNLVSGLARFVSNNEMVIEEKNTGENKNYTFDNAIIATGAHSIIPPFEGDATQEVLTSETLFSQDKLPENLLIVGGGPIGIELSQMFAKLGVQCTIVELLDSILYGVVEPEFVTIISSRLADLGVDIYTSSKVKEINRADGYFDIRFADAKGLEHKLKYENVLVATGKSPNIESLNLNSTGIQYDRKGITVNEFLETSVKGIYAAGDVIVGPKFAHTATYEAHIAATNIETGNSQKVSFSKNSWVLFSEPEIAAVGLTEAQAVAQGYDIITGVYDYSIDAAAQVMNEPVGFLKYVVDKKTLEIIGVHICHRNASSLAGEASLILAKRLTLKDVAQAVHPHPTLTEAFGFLAYRILGKSHSGQER